MILRWRKPDPIIRTRWSGPDGRVVALAQSNPAQPIAAVIGPPGPAGDADGALLVTNRLSEFSTSEAKTEARQNLELQNIDAGTFN